MRAEFANDINRVFRLQRHRKTESSILWTRRLRALAVQPRSIAGDKNRSRGGGDVAGFAFD
jgi:hypothetical protein